MTKKQIEIIQEKRNILPEAIIAAVCKLKEIHVVNWKDVDFVQLEQQIWSIKPHFIDVTSEVESGDANIEEKESYTCYFPKAPQMNQMEAMMSDQIHVEVKGTEGERV
jgi:hypothetical protein